MQLASEAAVPPLHMQERGQRHNFGVAQAPAMMTHAKNNGPCSGHATSSASAAAADEQMDAIRQLSAAVTKLSAAVDSNNATISRLETTVDKMCQGSAHKRARAANTHSKDLDDDDDDDDSDAISGLFSNDDNDSHASHHASPAEDLDRKTVRLDGLEVYAVVSAVTAGTLVAVFESYHPGDIVDSFHQGRYLEVLASSLFFCTGSVGIICGLHCIFVFSLVTMYGRTALGMERDDALEVFFAGTGLQRYHGFKTFVGSLYSMMILLIVTITSKVSDRPGVHLAALAVTARLMYYVYADTQTIMEKAGVIFAPPPTSSSTASAGGGETGERGDQGACVGSKKSNTSLREDDDSEIPEWLNRRPSIATTEGSSFSKRGKRKSSLMIGAEELMRQSAVERSPTPKPLIEEEIPAIEFSPSLEANASRHKICKVLRSLDPRGDNFHRGKERANRMAKFRAYVDGKYTSGVPPTFTDDDVMLLLLGTADDGDRFLPGLLRACGVPSKNHQGAGDHILLKKSAHDAIELLRYLVCDLGDIPVQNIFSKVFCSLPSSELRQIRLSLHIAGFGGKREGSKEDACRILTRYLGSCDARNNAAFDATAACNILDDVLPAQDARIALRGWIAQQPEDIQRKARAVIYLSLDGSARSQLSGDGYSGDAKSRLRGKSLPPPRAIQRKFQKQNA